MGVWIVQRRQAGIAPERENDDRKNFYAPDETRRASALVVENQQTVLADVLLCQRAGVEARKRLVSFFLSGGLKNLETYLKNCGLRKPSRSYGYQGLFNRYKMRSRMFIGSQYATRSDRPGR